MIAELIIGICVSIIAVLCFALFFHSADVNVKAKNMIQDIVQQINFVHQYIYQFEQQQEQNIMNLDRNIKAVYAQQQRVIPNSTQLCLGGTCITESDLIRIKNQIQF